MSIEDKIRVVQTIIDTEWRDSGGMSSDTAVVVQQAAAAAVLEGGAKVEAYMRIFTQDPAELAQMMPDPTKPAHLGKNLARAYLMGNGPCGPASPRGPELGLLFGVSGNLDEPEDGEPEGGEPEGGQPE